MKRFVIPAALLLSTAIFASPRAVPQSGSVDFTVRVTPSAGLEEPVRGFPFYLLTKSFDEISREADASYPKPDLDAFVDKLDVSKELKAWMKKRHTVRLSGEDFIHSLTPAEIQDVPEFYKAYMERNAGDQSINFPKPKYKASDKTKNPEKYAKLDQQYQEAILRFIGDHPETKTGMDLDLMDIDPSAKWGTLEAQRQPEIERRILEMARSKYLAGSTQTNLQGQALLRGIAPGNYWLSTLDVSADVGDARPRWNEPIAVRAGETTYVTLTNANAVPPPAPAQ